MQQQSLQTYKHGGSPHANQGIERKALPSFAIPISRIPSMPTDQRPFSGSSQEWDIFPEIGEAIQRAGGPTETNKGAAVTRH